MLFQKLLQPLAHILQVPGKNYRPRISHAYNYWLKVPADKLIVVKEIAHMLDYSIVL
jgi:geranylgeranyl diphosphate synthase type 3